jgi:hypothetical protein
MSSRLGFDSRGRRVAVVTSSALATVEAGHVFHVLGNLLLSTVSGDTVLYGWLGSSGRPSTAKERAEARTPYTPPSKHGWNPRTVPDDDELDERAAIKAARLEQERETVSLVAA